MSDPSDSPTPPNGNAPALPGATDAVKPAETPNGSGVSVAAIAPPLSPAELRASGEPETPATPAPRSGVANMFPTEKDSLQRVFDPAKFRLKDGKPQRDSMQRFVPLGIGGRRAVPAAGSVIAADAAAGALAAPPAEPPPDPHAIAADRACRGVYALGMTLGGPEEWLPTKDEHEANVIAVGHWFKQMDVKDVPPWVEAAITMGGYIVAHAMRPKTLTKLERFRLWLSNIFAGRRASAIVRKVDNL